MVHRYLLLAATGVAAAAWLVMTEIDSLLRSLSASSGEQFGISSVKGLSGGPTEPGLAIDLWRTGSDYSSLSLVRWYLLCGCVLVGLLLAGTGFVLSKIYRGRKWWLLAVLSGALEALENLLIFVAVRDPQGPPDTTVLFYVTLVKWLALGLTVLVAVTGTAVRIVARDLDIGLLRVLWHFRIQVIAAAALAFAVAWPSRDRLGVLQQLPDLTRSYADVLVTGDARWFWLRLAVATGTLLFAAAVVWFGGHWLRFAPGRDALPSAEPAPAENAAPEPWRREIMWGVLLVLGALIVIFAHGPLPKLPLLLVFLTVLVAHAFLGLRQPRPPARPWTAAHAYTLNWLTASVVSITGLGLVRGFAAPVLLQDSLATKGSPAFFAAGAVTAVVLGPLVLWALCWLNPVEWQAVGARIRKRSVPVAVTIALVVLAVGLGVAIGVRPITLAPVFGANGLLVVAVGIAALLLSGAVAVSQRSTPFVRYQDRISDTETLLRPVALPVTLLVLIVAALTGQLDAGGSYHDARYNGRGTTQPSTVSLVDSFASWQAAAERCHPSAAPPTVPLTQKPRTQPMVFVAAAGGGIRAAFWTEGVLDQVTRSQGSAEARACARDSVFLVSSASGGSIGAALWSKDPGTPGTAPAHGATVLADGTGLSALAAGLLFRDAAHALLGRDRAWDDRAALIEQTWIDRLPEYDLGAPFLETAGPASAAAPWKPLLMLNSTDLLTQCRVVLTRVAPQYPDPLADCDDPSQTRDPLAGTYYASDFANTVTCAPQERPMSVATAALLSGRFPFVTPTGSLYGCGSSGPSARRLQLADGGYLENTGMLTAIQEWLAVEPLVAAHNQSVLNGLAPAGTPLRDAIIVPTFVIISNSYRSEQDTRVPDPRSELVLPLGGNHAEEALVSPARLEVEARYLFCTKRIAGTELPGLTDPAPSCEDRFHVFAPRSRPEITAPLGFTLSQMSISSLQQQLADLEPDLTRLRTLLTP